MAKRMHVIANSLKCIAAMLGALKKKQITCDDPQLQLDAEIIVQIVDHCKQTIDGIMNEQVS